MTGYSANPFITGSEWISWGHSLFSVTLTLNWTCFLFGTNKTMSNIYNGASSQKFLATDVW